MSSLEEELAALKRISQFHKEKPPEGLEERFSYVFSYLARQDLQTYKVICSNWNVAVTDRCRMSGIFIDTARGHFLPQIRLSNTGRPYRVSYVPNEHYLTGRPAWGGLSLEHRALIEREGNIYW